MNSIECYIDILYIEDDEVDIKEVQREFKKVNERLRVAIAKNGESALDYLYGKKGNEKIIPKIILLDLNMPKMNGIEFLKILRNDPQFIDTKVFLLTGSYSTEDKLAVQDLNIRGLIIKPLEYSDALNVFWVLQEDI